MSDSSAFLKWYCLLFGIIFTACSTGGNATAIPTQILVPPLFTATPTSTLPIATLVTLTTPEDRLLPTDTPVVIVPIMAASVDFDPSFAFELRNDLARYLNVSPSIIRLAWVEKDVWFSDMPNCETPTVPHMDYLESGYRFDWLVGSEVYSHFIDNNLILRRCLEGVTMRDNLLMAVDPVAAELGSLAKRRIAQELDLPLRRVIIREIIPVTWTDTSLGCPQSDQVYSPVQIDGYRIVIGTDSEEYLFHTDSARLYVCDFSLEQLPAGSS